MLLISEHCDGSIKYLINKDVNNTDMWKFSLIISYPINYPIKILLLKYYLLNGLLNTLFFDFSDLISN